MKFATACTVLALVATANASTTSTEPSESPKSNTSKFEYNQTTVVTIGLDVVNIVVPHFLSFTVDFHEPNTTCAWDGELCWAPEASFLNINTQNTTETYPRLLHVVKHLSPAVLRVGGSPGDRVTYEFGNTSCNDDDFYCLTKEQWDSWQELVIHANITMAFGLNYLGMAKNGTWDSTNAKELIEYTYSKYDGKPPVTGFELGNELSTRGPKPKDVVSGFRELRGVIENMNLKYPPSLAGPACGNGGPNNPAWIEEFFEKGGKEVLDVATYHWYGQPSTDANLSSEMLTTKFMDAEIDKTKQTRKEFDSWAPELPLWLGEGAMAALSGQHGLTDRFEDTMWYIVRLGALAANGHSGWNRQTLLGGYYALVDHETFRPHPSWWAAVLHKRLMGTQVLSVATTQSGVYSFAHCAAGGANAGAGAVTVALVNIVNTQRSISFDGITSSTRQEQYCLTSSKLDSDFVNLNEGANLVMADDGSIPALQARSSSNGTFVMPGYSVCFVLLLDASHTACSSDELGPINDLSSDSSSEPGPIKDSSSDSSSESGPIDDSSNASILDYSLPLLSMIAVTATFLRS